MLCNVCQDAFVELNQLGEDSNTNPTSGEPLTRIFSSPFYKASHHSLPRLKYSALNGCQLCHLLWMAAPLEIHRFLDEYLQNGLPAHWLPCYLTLNRAIFKDDLKPRRLMMEYKYQTVVVNHEDYVQPFKKHFRLLSCEETDIEGEVLNVDSNTWSENSWATVRSWISNCFSKHNQCTPISELHQRKLPKRLIEIYKGNRIRILTLERASNHEIEYLALSHCWGSGPRLKLTSETDALLREGVEISKLCKTFQDAIVVTRRFWDDFGIRYLWIDSLCILQDSISDWRSESAIMGDIYQNAFCTLAATAAEDGSRGLFSDRDAQAVLPCLISVVPLNQPKKVLRCMDTDDWIQNVNLAPLNSRSWVLQERLLSPRVLHFAANQLYWECSGQEACESFPFGLPGEFGEQFKQLLPFSGGPYVDGPDQNNSRGPYLVWDEVMKKYSAGSLSRQSDRLVALSGIARKLQRHVIPQDTYLAGLWKADLPFQLLWDVEERGHPLQSSGAYVAPTWSWASRVATVPCEQETWTSASPLVEITSAVVTSVDQDRMGQISSGYLRLCGVLARGGLSRVHQPGSATPGIALKVGDKTISSAICRLDEGVNKTIHLPHVVYCLPVLRGLRNRIPRYKGLLLVPTGRETEFRRYGTFTTDSFDDEFLVSCQPAVFETGKLNSLGRYEIIIV
ncbi:uncharacterized protein A1O9_03669 [Exophiala aquamarina CBS 119918]|uniref:Heterokaryon incompatibility domain-containing protein n=1 Tax=Exophiala aquamarina CBS 119918 TaxID=1182545 RepID=A0A072PG67_9EURO|nr:uncharacterized protein A1O9_03669 [Exophiala aquamarina CBS 119918]KEF58826.1 hypothetical protein A1O9_03669 [Exophiala aquamarina CBS 119918]